MVALRLVESSEWLLDSQVLSASACFANGCIGCLLISEFARQSPYGCIGSQFSGHVSGQFEDMSRTKLKTGGGELSSEKTIPHISAWNNNSNSPPNNRRRQLSFKNSLVSRTGLLDVTTTSTEPGRDRTCIFYSALVCADQRNIWPCAPSDMYAELLLKYIPV